MDRRCMATKESALFSTGVHLKNIYTWCTFSCSLWRIFIIARTKEVNFHVFQIQYWYPKGEKYSKPRSKFAQESWMFEIDVWHLSAVAFEDEVYGWVSVMWLFENILFWIPNCYVNSPNISSLFVPMTQSILSRLLYQDTAIWVLHIHEIEYMSY